MGITTTLLQPESRSYGKPSPKKFPAAADIPVAPDEVVVTPGAKPILFFSLLALAQEGDEVIYPDPGFPIYESMIRYVGAQAGADGSA